MNFRPEISKEEINSLPLGKYEGPVQLITDKQEAERACKKIARSKVIGIDTEARPAFKRGQYFPVSLVQIADEEQVYLFRILETGPIEALTEVLEDPRIIKVGIAIKDDLNDLGKSMPHQPQTILDLNEFAQDLGFISIGARKLAAIILHIRISKAQQVSNWENKVLSPAQISYAATDAWLCREIYLRLIE